MCTRQYVRRDFTCCPSYHQSHNLDVISKEKKSRTKNNYKYNGHKSGASNFLFFCAIPHYIRKNRIEIVAIKYDEPEVKKNIKKIILILYKRNKRKNNNLKK